MVRIFFGKGGLRRQRIAWYNTVMYFAESGIPVRAAL